MNYGLISIIHLLSNKLSNENIVKCTKNIKIVKFFVGNYELNIII